MLIVRSLCREVFHTLLLVMGVLLFLVVANMLIKTMHIAANENVINSVVLNLIGVTLPKFIGLLLPIALFLSLLITYGKLFAENELLVCFASGMSWSRLLGVTMIPAVTVAVIVAGLTLLVMPTMSVNQKVLSKQSSNTNNISLIRPGRFVSFNNDARQVIYVGESQPEAGRVNDLFIFEKNGPGDIPQLISAPTGTEGVLEEGAHYFTLSDGYVYRFSEGALDVERIDFDRYSILIEDNKETITPDLDGIATRDLWASDRLHWKAELQWRIVIPLSVIVLSCLAVSICQARPRTSRYGKMLPGILVFIVYFNCLSLSKSWVMNGAISPTIGLWWVPALFGLTALVGIAWKDMR